MTVAVGAIGMMRTVAVGAIGTMAVGAVAAVAKTGTTSAILLCRGCTNTRPGFVSRGHDSGPSLTCHFEKLM